MPAAIVSKNEVLERLLSAFRDKGYEGATLAELSAATGLRKSSLYHYFPDGKADIAEQVMAHLDQQLAADLYAPLRSTGTPVRKLGAMLNTIDAFYDGGRRACLLARLSGSVDRAKFRKPLRKAFTVWMKAVEELCLEAGLPAGVARARAEDLVLRIQGALIVCAGTDDYGVFARTIAALRTSVLEPGR